MDLNILIQKDLAAQRYKLVRLHELNSPQILTEKQLTVVEYLEKMRKAKADIL